MRNIHSGKGRLFNKMCGLNGERFYTHACTFLSGYFITNGITKELCKFKQIIQLPLLIQYLVKQFVKKR